MIRDQYRNKFTFPFSLKINMPTTFCYINNQSDYVLCYLFLPSTEHNIERMVFTPVKGNSLFTIESIKSMCDLQKSMLATFAAINDSDLAIYSKPYNEYYGCQNTWSILNVLTDIGKKTSCDDITDDDLSALGDLLNECASYYEHGNLTCNMDSSDCQIQVPGKCLENDRVVNTFHYLTPTSFLKETQERTFKLKSAMMFLFIQWEDRQRFYEANFEKKVVNDGVTKVDALYLNGLKYDLFNTKLESDALYVGLGAAVAIFIIVLYTGSIFITLMTIINIAMSLIVAYFVYRVVLQLAFFSFVNVLAIVLLIGIGADDTFVFIDIWKKAKEENPGKDRAFVLHETIRHAAVTMFVTSFTTGSALYANMISSIIAIKLFAVFAGTAIMANFVFTITWLPVVVVMDDWCGERCCGWLKSGGRKIKRYFESLSKMSDKIVSCYFLTLVFKLRFVWIALLGLLGAAGAYLIFVSPKLSLPTTADFPVLKLNHPLEKYSQKYMKKYDFENDNVNLLPYIAVFGVHPIDDRGTWDPDSVSSKNVTLIDNFDVSEPESQKWLLNFCSDLRKQPFVNERNEVHCFMEEIKYRMGRPCSENLYNLIPDTCCNRNDFPFSKSDFQLCAPTVCFEFGSCNGRGVEPFGIPYGPLYTGENNTISAFSIVAQSTYRDGPYYEEMHEFWTTADTWTSSQIDKAPLGMQGGGWFITKGWYQIYFYALQRGLATGTAESMGISLAIAAAVLFLTTCNALISLYAMVSVAGTVFVTIGSLVLLGWQLNITECVILSIAVGLSVDFTIHYGVAYRIAPVTDRKGRSEFALKTLGAAILVAALSTFSAGAMMMPAIVLSYAQLGTFMMLVMSTSWVYANFFFLSLCRIVGPNGNIAQIPLPKCTPCTGTDRVENIQIDNDFIADGGPGDTIHIPYSDNVEMDAPNTMQFNSLVISLQP